MKDDDGVPWSEDERSRFAILVANRTRDLVYKRLLALWTRLSSEGTTASPGEMADTAQETDVFQVLDDETVKATVSTGKLP